MIFIETILKGAYIIEIEKHEDERGFFARSWCQREFKKNGLNPGLVQCNTTFNRVKGTLRGMHYQVKPYEEAKLVRCTMGSLHDVIVDLRPDSSSFMHYVGVVLSRDNRKMLYVPEGFAHGFLTLDDNTEVFYQMSEFYHPESSRGFRWNDPAIGVEWPLDVEVISDMDRSYPDLKVQDVHI